VAGLSVAGLSVERRTAGITMATVLVNAGLTTFDKILDMNARDLELVRSFTPIYSTRMWASAQRDGRPAEHSWRHLFNAAKFG